MKKVIDFIKKRYLLLICIIAAVLLIVVFPKLEKKGTFSLNDNEYVTLECPMAVASSDNISCNIVLHATGKTILSVNANYNLDEKLAYESFSINPDSGFELYSVDENNEESDLGFAVVNLEGVDSEVTIGTVTFGVDPDHIPEVEPNTTFSVGLTNVELVTDEVVNEIYEMLDGSDTTTSVRIKNNDASLSKIRLYAGGEEVALQVSQNNNTVVYSGSVSNTTTEVNISVTKTDENASLGGSGIGEDLAVHYGTNSFTIIVTAEDGIAQKTYIVNVNRAYKYTGDAYQIVNNDTIYTAHDSNDVIINKLGTTSDGVHFAFDDTNHLVAYYETESLGTINRIGFNINYTVIDKVIYLNGDTAYESVMSNITNGTNSGTFTFKVLNTNNQEITDDSATIGHGYKLEVYYNDLTESFDTYTFSNDYLVINNLIYDDNAKIIKRIVAGTTYSTLKNNFETSGVVSFTDTSGNVLSDNDIVKTGDSVNIRLSNETITYRLSVLGDTSGDGIIEINDVGRLYKFYNHKIPTLEVGG